MNCIKKDRGKCILKIKLVDNLNVSMTIIMSDHEIGRSEGQRERERERERERDQVSIRYQTKGI